jgi:hypothetical protein
MSSILITEKFWLNHEVLHIQMDLLNSFCKSLAYYRTIHQDYERVMSSKEYWCHTMNTNLLRAISDWCVVFGPDSNESHWKNISEDHKKEVSVEVKPLILKASGFTDTEWRAYWGNLTDFRHQYVAHRVPNFDEPVPHMTKAFEIAVEYFEWLKEQLRPSRNEPKPLNVLFAEYQIEVLEVYSDYIQKV